LNWNAGGTLEFGRNFDEILLIDLFFYLFVLFEQL